MSMFAFTLHLTIATSLAVVPASPMLEEPSSPTVEPTSAPDPDMQPMTAASPGVANTTQQNAHAALPPAPTQVVSAPQGPTPEEQRVRMIKSDREKGQTLAIAGGVTLGTLYVLTSAAGAAVMDDAHGVKSKERFGAMLMVPVVGPFIAPAFSSGLKESASGSWAAVLVGLGQTASLGLMIAGLVQRARAQRELYVAPIAAQGTGGLMVGGRF